ncbi:invasin domain 3-containing protein [Enterobacteriaceae bacterium LUAb1]
MKKRLIKFSIIAYMAMTGVSAAQTAMLVKHSNSIPVQQAEASLPALNTDTTTEPKARASTAPHAAQIAAQSGEQLAQMHHSSDAGQWAINTGTQQAQQEVQQWLSQYGTAHVQLNTDSHFSLKNTQLDMLYPLWEDEQMLWFTQGSVHRTDDRNQVNLGSGIRYFGGSSMLGANAFYDDDLTGRNARYGLGVEYWRDDLKLSSNIYARLTSWKDAPGLDDYSARPANGWDVRAEGYLPAMPSLGAKLAWEQYYGDEVGLFGKDNRQNNPHALTAGLNWTPVPLVTVGADRRQGSGEHDSQVNLDLRWQPGRSLASQLDANQVAFHRSLAGSRHDLVERNNDIVLEYREKASLHLKIAPLVTGHTGDIVPLNVLANATYGVDHIAWEKGSLENHGGKVLDQGNAQFSVLLPPLQPGGVVQNTYMLKAVEYDRRGHTSEPAFSEVIVESVPVAAELSDFDVKPDTILINGQSTLTLTLKDSNGNLLSGLTDVTFQIKSATGTAEKNSWSLSEIKETEAGVYTAVLTGLIPGKLDVTPVVGQQVLTEKQKTVTVIQQVPSSQTSTISVASKIPVNTTTPVLLTVNDADNKPVIGLTDISAKLDGIAGPGSSIGSWTDKGDGTYSATLTGGGTAGPVNIMPTIGGQDAVQTAATVILEAGERSAEHSTITADPDHTAVHTTSVLTLTVHDANNNPISDLAVTTAALSGVGASGSSVGNWTDNHNGTYSATLTGGGTAGPVNIMPQIDGQDAVQNAATVTLEAGARSAEHSTITADPDHTAVHTTSVLTLTVHDADDNPISGLAVTTAALTGAGTPGSSVSGWSDNHNGTYSATLTGGGTAGPVNIMPQIDGQDAVQNAATVTLEAGARSAEHSTITADPDHTAVHTTSALTLTVHDADDNPISGLTVTTAALSGVGAPGSSVSGWSDNHNGTYSATLTGGGTAGPVNIMPQIDGQDAVQNAATVTLEAGARSAEHSTITADPDHTAVHTTSVLTLTVHDADDNPISGLTVTTAALSGVGAPGSSVSGWSDNHDGTYSATLTGGGTAGPVNIMPQIDGQDAVQSAATVTLEAGARSAEHSTITADPDHTAVHTTSVLTLTVHDADDNPISGLNVTTAALSGVGAPGSSVSGWSDNHNGTYSATLTGGGTAGPVNIMPQIDGQDAVQNAATVTLEAGARSAEHSTITADPDHTAVHTTSVLMLTVHDADDNPISGLTVTTAALSGVGAPGSSVSGWSDNHNGTYSATLTGGGTAGPVNIMPQIDGQDAVQNAATVTLEAGARSAEHSTITADPDHTAVHTTSVLTLTVHDADDNPISGLTVTTAALSGVGAPGSSVSGWSDNHNGTYSATLTGGGTAGPVNIMPQIDSQDAVQTAATVTLEAGLPSDETSSLFVPRPIIEAGKTTDLTLTVKDIDGNLIDNLDVTEITALITGDDNDVVQGTTVSTWTKATGKGKYTATLTASQKMGNVTVMPQINAADAITTGKGVQFKAGLLSPEDSEITPKIATIHPGETLSLTLTAKDRFQNPVTNITVTSLMTGDPKAAADNSSISAWQDNGDGTYTAVLTAGQTAGELTVSPQYEDTDATLHHSTVTIE